MCRIWILRTVPLSDALFISVGANDSSELRQLAVFGKN
jgi:hypothetical protein